MPEGNEVHRWAERHNAAFAGRKLHVEGPTGRFTDAHRIDNRVLQRVMAVGKHLGYDFGADRILHVHLGRFGDWTEGPMPYPEVKGALRLRMWRVGARSRKDAPAALRGKGYYRSDDGSGALAPGTSTGPSCAARPTARSTRKRNGRRCLRGSAPTR